MIHVVTGFMRTGTSMMMKALEAGGLDAAYDRSREDTRKQHADEFYDPNEGGLYELTQKDYRNIDFPRKYDGRLVKCLAQGPTRMRVMDNGIRLVQMVRDTEEIRQSYEAFFGSRLMRRGKDIELMWDRVREEMVNRKDVLSFTRLNYRDVVNNPYNEFQKLLEDGWEFDIDKCVEVVNPKLCRYRIELLEVGV